MIRCFEEPTGSRKRRSTDIGGKWADMEKRLGFLDGLKAVATILVFNIHFFNAYYCGVYTLDPADFHTKTGIEWWIGATPLNIIYAGKAGARLFLTVSAFLLVYGYLHKRDDKKLLMTPVKKYMRLFAPIVVVNLLVCLFMSAGAYQNGKAAVLAGSVEHFGVYNQFAPDFLQAFLEGMFGCFLFGDNRYNGPLWFIRYEFLGCIFIAAVLYITRKQKSLLRLCVYGALALLLIRTDYLCMVLAAAVAELSVMAENGDGFIGVWQAKLHAHNAGRSRAEKVPYCSMLLWLIFLGSLFLLTYPSLGKTEGTIYAFLPPKVLFYYNIALPGFLFALLYLKPVQRVLNRRLLRRFEKISYCFYLIHFPVLCTVSAAFFVAMYDKWNYHVLALTTYVLAFLVSVFLAWGLRKCVDAPVQKLCREIM